MTPRYLTPSQINLPKVGDVLRNRGINGNGSFTARVAGVFQAGSDYHMILEWIGYNPSLNTIGRRTKSFTTERWRDRWVIIKQKGDQYEDTICNFRARHPGADRVKHSE